MPLTSLQQSSGVPVGDAEREIGMARIAIGGFSHKTNCFVPMRTDYAYYEVGGEMPPLHTVSRRIQLY